jgi:hypothetical protein
MRGGGAILASGWSMPAASRTVHASRFDRLIATQHASRRHADTMISTSLMPISSEGLLSREFVHGQPIDAFLEHISCRARQIPVARFGS